MSKGVIATGIHCPIIREGDNLQQIVIDSIFRTQDLEDGDIIGITESVVARAQGNYVTVDQIAKETIRLFGKDPILTLVEPIYSRNRFSMILKGIARACKAINLIMPEFDEVGNPRSVNPFTGVNMMEYYTEICKNENCEVEINGTNHFSTGTLICKLHDLEGYNLKNMHTLMDYFPGMCQWGLLGSNKANEETLKLFPDKAKAENLVKSIQDYIKEKLGIHVFVCVYGDGCFHAPGIPGVPGSSINEFADPVAMVAYTNPEIFESSPYEIKLKAFADGRFKDLSGKELEQAIKKEIQHKEIDSIRSGMKTQGTTPRRLDWLLASLMDLISGSGDKGTPIVLVRNYFKNYATC